MKLNASQLHALTTMFSTDLDAGQSEIINALRNKCRQVCCMIDDLANDAWKSSPTGTLAASQIRYFLGGLSATASALLLLGDPAVTVDKLQALGEFCREHGLR